MGLVGCMAEIDPDLLPGRCLVDTGVLIRALGQREDEHADKCRSFFDAMVGAKRQMLVAAPTVAELLRGNPQPLPRTRSVVVVSFDNTAAEILGVEIPVSVLHDHSAKTGHTRSYLKYDAMIVACARRWEAQCIVALDDDHVALARHAGLVVRHPAAFVRRQTVLPFERRRASTAQEE